MQVHTCLPERLGVKGVCPGELVPGQIQLEVAVRILTYGAVAYNRIQVIPEGLNLPQPLDVAVRGKLGIEQRLDHVGAALTAFVVGNSGGGTGRNRVDHLAESRIKAVLDLGGIGGKEVVVRPAVVVRIPFRTV